ncbi:hypothetical protein QFC20_007791 [Naganishia adeliensis]|uniref:Uncharacterized protein n=1 Tax=Naganishia adeliensis TaxID=92952 RepID=A0ACC2UV70_9TREE|nr:hypothetical protein QFC20_007791 [Naganishia adeliensis]
MLAEWSREFGLSLAELRCFVRGFQIDLEPLAPMAVGSAEKFFKLNASRILARIGCVREGSLRPRTVKMRDFPPSARLGDPQYPRFRDQPAPHLDEERPTTASEWFPDSGLEPSSEDYDAKFKSLKQFHTGGQGEQRRLFFPLALLFDVSYRPSSIGLPFPSIGVEADYVDFKGAPRPRAPLQVPQPAVSESPPSDEAAV